VVIVPFILPESHFFALLECVRLIVTDLFKVELQTLSNENGGVAELALSQKACLVSQIVSRERLGVATNVAHVFNLTN